ncbi:hypothetical protein [Paenibacillus lutimineralis]|uniref:Tail fiber protein n=1 Tax=Paenibacillus lutimineralis TaxID=2707005 RepID=A0A3S9UYG9_9BACL|nr:hypothetical protein [Paenibacillus lutimineralis]AZS15375.1 hypothetical protein EI981_13475 [Paenibacillus lutimineralis]
MTKGITLQEIDTSATSRLVIKDSAGRAKVTAPSAADEIALKSTVDNAVGNLSTLQTIDKSNVVKAINELFTNVSNGKSSIAAAITGKGVAASGSDTFDQLAAKIGQIVIGKKYASGLLTSSISMQKFYYYENNNSNNYYTLIISGLDFVPSFIFCKSASDYARPGGILYSTTLPTREYPNARISIDYYLGDSGHRNMICNSDVLLGPNYVMPTQDGNKSHHWFAIE